MTLAQRLNRTIPYHTIPYDAPRREIVRGRSRHYDNLELDLFVLTMFGRRVMLNIGPRPVRPVSRKPPLRSHELIRYNGSVRTRQNKLEMRTSDLVGVLGITSGFRVHL
jgi:hypothetical protein